MNREEFTSHLEVAFEALFALLQTLPPDKVSQPMTEGQWSLRDMAAHLIFWDRIAIRALEASYQGQEFDWNSVSNWDVLNANAASEMQGTPLKRLTAEWQITHDAFAEALRRVPDERLLINGELPPWLIENVSGHYEYHAEQVKE